MRKPNAEIAAKIKTAVTELMKEKNPSKIGMRDIAERCGITAANIYHYYKNKDELFKEIGSISPKNSAEETNTKNDDTKRTNMKEISKLIDYRKDIKVVDATLRDGGLVNDFYFPEGFAKALYETNVKAGVDYMEFGYKADKDMFDVNKFGKWKFCNEEDMRAIVGENNTDLKLAIMADVGRCNYKTDILDRSESVIDLIRVATYLHQMPTAIDMIEDAKKKGYEVSCNIMAISTAQEGDVRAALDMLMQSPVDVIYIVDSFGSMYPEQMQRLAALYVE